MTIPVWVWVATLLGLAAALTVDLAIVGRRPHEPSVRESSTWVGVYVGLAVLFGVGIWLAAGSDFAAQFAAGWVTEYSLSLDNLFVFVIIMGRFAVPRAYQQKILMIGVILALVMRGLFIAAGAALIHQFVWVFYFFGVFLLYTAFRLIRGGHDEQEEFHENRLIRLSRRLLPVSKGADGARLTTRAEGRFRFTPLFIVVIAIGTTDVVFALDSIPAIFGLTTEAYIVFTANVFALMGLRQLYFLLGGLLDRLKYLSVGLSMVLAFIGVKLGLTALHGNNLPFINHGDPVGWAPQIPIWMSLSVIVSALAITTAVSLISSRRDGVREAALAGVARPAVDVDRQNVRR